MPVWVVYCHCDECRRTVCAPYTLWAGFPTAATFVSGWVRWETGISINVSRGFCGRCGAAVIYRDRSMFNDETYFNAATLNEPERLAPDGHAYWAERVSFVMVTDDLPKWPGRSRERRAESEDHSFKLV